MKLKTKLAQVIIESNRMGADGEQQAQAVMNVIADAIESGELAKNITMQGKPVSHIYNVFMFKLAKQLRNK